uniref:Acetyl-coenzyme A transporter 1-like n=1 Tax=Dermatophagoides pteronyssinus TaxID=6956 RepID=A0A6P6YKK9_DERPT|nr:acetyl-coenzyme A transporter 1-like [Dermatophagoides pteronyssinus]
MRRALLYKVFLLVLLYSLQAIPIGISTALPVVLQRNGASYSSLALFNLAVLPFTLKLLWAPLVDSTQLKPFGRRKSCVAQMSYFSHMSDVSIGGTHMTVFNTLANLGSK